MTDATKLSDELKRTLRDDFARTVVEAIEEYYPRCFFPERDIVLGANSSDCPLLRVNLGDGEVYHVTITRARK